MILYLLDQPENKPKVSLKFPFSWHQIKSWTIRTHIWFISKMSIKTVWTEPNPYFSLLDNGHTYYSQPWGEWCHLIVDSHWFCVSQLWVSSGAFPALLEISNSLLFGWIARESLCQVCWIIFFLLVIPFLCKYLITTLASFFCIGFLLT